MPAKITFEEFEKRVHKKFGDDVDLSLIDKTTFNYQQKYPVICKKHNKIAYRYPKLLLKNNSICEDCYFELQSSISTKPRKLSGKYNMFTLNDIEQILLNKNTLYSIADNSIDKNSRIYRNTKVKCNCIKHGIFETSVVQIIENKWCGCEQCRREYNKQQLITAGEIRRLNFIEESIKTHGNQYDYSLVDLTGKLKKVKIICPKHGIFEMYPSNHTTRGQGCPMCNQDKFNCERRLGEIIKMNFPNISIIQQYHGFLGRQSLDYFLPEYKIGIEYQGSQHFFENEWYTDERHYLEKRKNLDKQKYDKCKENNVTLLYFTFSKEFSDIKYFDKVYNNINEFLERLNELVNK